MPLVTKLRYWRLPRKAFWEHTKTMPSGCIEWQGTKHPQGYGVAPKFIGEPDEPRAHRKSWVMAHGEIPEGLLVLHKCDNPPCVNPDHLFLGTDLDNAQDMRNKRRNRKPAGADHPMTPFVPEDIMRIREAHLFGARPIDLARSWGVSDAAIHSIIKRRSWAHLE
jgi:hypothetical protein